MIKCPECGSESVERRSSKNPIIDCWNCSYSANAIEFGAKCNCEHPHHLPAWCCPVHGEVIVPMD